MIPGVSVAVGGLSGVGVQLQGAGVLPVVPVEGEHGVQWSGLGVEGGIAHGSGGPVVLDEFQDRGLVGGGVVDVVCAGVAGDDQQGESWPVAAAVLVATEGVLRVGAGTAVVALRGL